MTKTNEKHLLEELQDVFVSYQQKEKEMKEAIMSLLEYYGVGYTVGDSIMFELCYHEWFLSLSNGWISIEDFGHIKTGEKKYNCITFNNMEELNQFIQELIQQEESY